MSGQYHPIADPGHHGADQRRLCAADLDRYLDAPSPENAAAFLGKWGGAMSVLLRGFEQISAEAGVDGAD